MGGTARIAAEADPLRDRLGAILQSLADAVTVQAPNGEILYANDSAVRMLGFASVGELLATPVAQLMERFELFDEEGRPLPATELPGRIALRGETAPERRLRFRIRGEPGERWSVVRANPVTDERGEVVLAVNVFQTSPTVCATSRGSAFSPRRARLLSSSLEYESTCGRSQSSPSLGSRTGASSTWSKTACSASSPPPTRSRSLRAGRGRSSRGRDRRTLRAAPPASSRHARSS